MKKPIQFGKYYLLERVNVGGMAEVFKAKTVGVEGFERQLAVKRILPNIAEDKEFITMFIDEAKIAGQLSHANICQIFDLGKVDDAFFIALEYVSGKDLRALFDRARQTRDGGGLMMPIPQSCFVMMKVCEGLDYAHNKRDTSGHDLGLVHRDVSPQNVLISYEGEVKIIDFGIAKAAGKASKTQAGILKGKFGYMSPEQVRGLPLDRRSDIFAVGIVLYEVLTGERLFHGDSDFSVLEKVRNVEILPPTAYNRKIPEELERIVLKALAKDVEDRYQNAIDLHDDLQAFMYTSGEFYSRKELAAYMKRTFAAELAIERTHDEEFASIGAMMGTGKSGLHDSKPSPAPKKTLGPGARSTPPPSPVPAAAAEAGMSSSAGKTTQPFTGGKKLEIVPSYVAAGAGEAIVDDLGWDDDEVETHVYETEHDAGDSVLDEEDVDEDSLPPLDQLELSSDGAPVPAKAPRLEGEKPFVILPRAIVAPAAAPAVQKLGTAPTEIGPSPITGNKAKPNGREVSNAPVAALPLVATPLLGAPVIGGVATPATPSKTVNLTAPSTAKSPRETVTPGSVPPPSQAARPAPASREPPKPSPASSGPASVVAPVTTQQPQSSRSSTAAAPSQMEPLVQPTMKVAAPLPSPAQAARAATTKTAPTLANGSAMAVDPPGYTETVPRLPARSSSMPLYAGIGLAVLAVGGIGIYMATRPTTGELALSVSPAEGSRILLDGQPVTLAEASHLVRAPGAHALGIEHDGYKAYSGQVDIQLGQRSERAVTLDPLPRSTFTLVSTPAGAIASLDGSVLGATPFKAEGLAPGKHVLELKLAGHATWTQNLELEPGKAIELTATLAPAVEAPVAAAVPPSEAVVPVVAPAVAVAPPVAAPHEAAANVPATPSAAAPAQVAALIAVPTQPAAAPLPPPLAAPLPRLPRPAPVVAVAALPPTARPTPAPAAPSAAAEVAHGRRLPAPPPVKSEPESEPPPAPSHTRAEAPPARASGEGYLRIGSKPWTKIAIDGRDTGLVTPQQQIKLGAGAHRVTLNNPQFGISQSFSIEIRAGSTETIIKDLRPKEEEE